MNQGPADWALKCRTSGGFRRPVLDGLLYDLGDFIARFADVDFSPLTWIARPVRTPASSRSIIWVMLFPAIGMLWVNTSTPDLSTEMLVVRAPESMMATTSPPSWRRRQQDRVFESVDAAIVSTSITSESSRRPEDAG